MIKDFWEIKDEKDRELYVRIRNVIDDWFLASIKDHEIKDHAAHECFNKELNDEKHNLNKFLSDYKTIKEQKMALIVMGDEISDRLATCIQMAIILVDKADELVTKN